MTESTTVQGPGKVWIWLVLLVAFIACGIGIYFMGPWLQDEVNSAPGADAGAPVKDISGE